MTYLDNGATSFHKPAQVRRAVRKALLQCANPGRGGYSAAMNGARTVLRCRCRAADLFACNPEQVVFTANCTQGLNMAIKTLVKPGSRVVLTGFEHNAVTRPLHKLKAEPVIAGTVLFNWEDTLSRWEDALKTGPEAAVFTYVSNVFGYILPVEEMAELCLKYRVPFIIDAAQAAGVLPVNFRELRADFIAMPGHKGLLGPQGTGILLCSRLPESIAEGGTGSVSLLQEMPDFLPDRGEAGTLNVPGIAGLSEGMAWLQKKGIETICQREHTQMKYCAEKLRKLGLTVFSGDHQCSTLSYVSRRDCQAAAEALGQQNIAVRAGLHCAPLAHRSAGTLETGTVRISFGTDACLRQSRKLIAAVGKTEGEM